MTNSKVIFILDWDDTLFPTSFMISKNYVSDIEPLADELYAEYVSDHKSNLFMKILESRIVKLIENFQKYGTVIILTNASVSWVHYSAKLFMPKLYKIVGDLGIVSGRKYADVFTDQTFWKYSCMLTETKDYHHIISIGDSTIEYDAIGLLMDDDRKKMYKRIKLSKEPCNEIILEQINLLITMVSFIHDYETNLHLTPVL